MKRSSSAKSAGCGAVGETLPPMGVGPAAALGKRRKASIASCPADGGRVQNARDKDAHTLASDASAPLAQAASRRRGKGVDLYCYEEMDESFVGFKERASERSDARVSDAPPTSLGNDAPSVGCPSAFSAATTAAKGKRSSLSSYGDLSEACAHASRSCLQTGRNALPGDDLYAVASKLSFSVADAARRMGKSGPKVAMSGPTALARYPMDWSLKRVANITSCAPLDWVLEYRNKCTLPGQHVHMPLSLSSRSIESHDASRQESSPSSTAPLDGVDTPSASELCCDALLQVPMHLSRLRAQFLRSLCAGVI